jgi:hypothetical protein
MPRAGGVGDQDAWLWEALIALRDVHNTILREREKQQAEKPTKGRAKTDADG